jgi:ribosomal protein S18 acetylase RimI-like enzyme
VTIRTAEPRDFPAIAALHARSWRVAYRGILSDAFLDHDVEEDRRRLWEARRAGELDPERSRVTVIERNGSLEAFVCTILDADPEWGALVDNLHVTPSSRGQGLGRILMSEAASWVLARRLGSALHLWVFERNRAAVGFYERLGGVVTARVVDPAPDGHDVESLRYSWREPACLVREPDASGRGPGPVRRGRPRPA